jgi:hypothetical protein
MQAGNPIGIFDFIGSQTKKGRIINKRIFDDLRSVIKADKLRIDE